MRLTGAPIYRVSGKIPNAVGGSISTSRSEFDRCSFNNCFNQLQKDFDVAPGSLRYKESTVQ